jgi:hypothetical protein
VDEVGRVGRRGGGRHVGNRREMVPIEAMSNPEDECRGEQPDSGRGVRCSEDAIHLTDGGTNRNLLQ